MMFIYTCLGLIAFICFLSVIVNSSIYQRLTLTCYKNNFDLMLQWNLNGCPIITDNGVIGYGDMRKKFTQDFTSEKLSENQYEFLCDISRELFRSEYPC